MIAMKIVTTQQMKAIEAASLDHGLSYPQLMENAGKAAAQFIRKVIKHPQDTKCIVFCGKGNNGGDGFVVTRELFNDGVKVVAVLTDGVPVTSEAQSMLDELLNLGAVVIDYQEHADQVKALSQNTDIVVDAIYGTGFSGEPNELHKEIFALINSSVCAVFSLDVPSGIRADSCADNPYAVQADFTLCFDSMKLAHYLEPASLHCGRTIVMNIGIEDACRENVGISTEVMEEEEVLGCLPQRVPNSHKGTYGKFLNISGSLGFTGAAILSTTSALRCGAGYVTLASPEPVIRDVTPVLPEATTMLLKENGEHQIDPSNIPELLERAKRCTAVLVGCGLGKSEDTRELVFSLIRGVECPLIIDADGLNVLASNPEVLLEKKGTIILTPHAVEMSRLSGKRLSDIQGNRFETAVSFAEKYGVILVLKGPATIVTDGKTSYINSTGNAGLAKAGSGDVLAGMIGSFAAQKLSGLDAARCGVYLHGMAADRCAKRLSQYGMLPSDLMTDLCQIFVEHEL